MSYVLSAYAAFLWTLKLMIMTFQKPVICIHDYQHICHTAQEIWQRLISYDTSAPPLEA